MPRMHNVAQDLVIAGSATEAKSIQRFVRPGDHVTVSCGYVRAAIHPAVAMAV